MIKVPGSRPSRLFAVSAMLIALVLMMSACSKEAAAPVVAASTAPSPVATSPSTSASASPLVSGSPAPSVSPGTEQPELSLKKAVVDGRYRGGGFFGTQLQFTAVCDEGPCLTVATGRGTRLNFRYKGGKYLEQLGGKTRCGSGSLGFDIPVDYTYTFRVKKAEWLDGVWTATLLQASSMYKTKGGQRSSSYTTATARHTQTLTCKSQTEHDKGIQIRL